jgi:RimJ/RimL family protein N-acetyltransferase
MTFEEVKTKIMDLPREDRLEIKAYLDRLARCRFQFRGLRLEDEGWLEDWFEDTELRRRMGGCLPVKSWLEFACTTPRQWNGVALERDVPVGVVLTETDASHETVIAVFTRPNLRGQGVGRRILEETMIRFSDTQRFVADIEQDNPRSMACFRACGFTETAESIDPTLLRFEYRSVQSKEPS